MGIYEQILLNNVKRSRRTSGQTLYVSYDFTAKKSVDSHLKLVQPISSYKEMVDKKDQLIDKNIHQ